MYKCIIVLKLMQFTHKNPKWEGELLPVVSEIILCYISACRRKQAANKKLFPKFNDEICVLAMVCVPCIVIPFFLFIWHRYIQPIMLKFWNPWKAVETKKEVQMASTKLENKNSEENCTSPIVTEDKKTL
jgi:hypothetical protein